MGRTTYVGPVRSLGGFYAQGPDAVLNIADATNTLSPTVAGHAGRLIKINDGSLTVTLPTIDATADGTSSGPSTDPNNANNQGTTFHFYVETVASALIFQTDGTDKFYGGILMHDADDDSVFGFSPAATNDVMTLNGTTTGGIVGTLVKFTVLTTAKYLVEGVVLGSGIIATPFSDS
jgi:hypothetical protein